MIKQVPTEPSPRQPPPGVARLVGCAVLSFTLILFLSGIALLSFTYHRAHLQASSADWPSVEGRIIAFTTEKGERGGKSPLAYEFDVSGKTYRSTQVVFIDSTNIQYEDWLSLANDLPKEGAVTVYYDPADPGRSVLKKGAHPASSGDLTFGWIFTGGSALFLLGVVSTIHTIRKQMASRPS